MRKLIGRNQNPSHYQSSAYINNKNVFSLSTVSSTLVSKTEFTMQQDQNKEFSKEIWVKAADNHEALTLQNIFVTMLLASSVYTFRIMSGRDKLD